MAIISQAESAGGRVRDTQMGKIKTRREKEKKGEITEKKEEAKRREIFIRQPFFHHSLIYIFRNYCKFWERV